MNAAYQVLLESDKVVEEPRGIRKDGSVFYKCVTMISKRGENGEFYGHHCFMSDISQRKQHEEEILRSNQELDDFAYIASHDLKEPLRGMRSHVKILEEEHQEALGEDARHRISRITTLSERMESLIRDLLNYSRLGREVESAMATDLNQIVKEVNELISDSDDIYIEVVDPLPVLQCDKSQIAVLFRNLISNGLKYNDSKKKHIQIGCYREEPYNTTSENIFFVKDNGIGIDERFHDDIFKIFRRLHKKETFGGGTGSGLTFVRKVVNHHGGEIWLESKPGEGSTFYFTLPSSDAHNSDQAA